MCDECYHAYKEEEKGRDTSGVCEWCKSHRPTLRPQRDFDEGLHGRVYQVCDECIKIMRDQIESYLHDYD